MFSMSATAPNSARKNQRHRRAITSPVGVGVGGGGGSNKSGNATVTTDSAGYNNLSLHRSQNNIQHSFGEQIATTSNNYQQPLISPPSTPRLRQHPSPDNETLVETTPTIYNFDDRDEESNGQQRRSHGTHIMCSEANEYDDVALSQNNNHNTAVVESISSKEEDSSLEDSPLLLFQGKQQKSTSATMRRNDSLSANIDDMDLVLSPINQQHHFSPEQQKQQQQQHQRCCSPEMKKNILLLLEKGGKQQHHQQKQQSETANRLTDNTLEQQEEEVLINTKRLETEENSASTTLSISDLLNLQQCCTLSSSSSTNNYHNNNCNKSGGNDDSAVKRVTANNGDELLLIDGNNNNDFRRSGSMEPMVEVEKEERKNDAGHYGKGRAIVATAAMTATVPLFKCDSSPEWGRGHNDNDDDGHNHVYINDNKSESSSPLLASTSHPTQPKSTPSSSPMINRSYNDSSTSPMSEVTSTLMERAAAAAAAAAHPYADSPCSSAGIRSSVCQENDDEYIGGDTYFEDKVSSDLVVVDDVKGNRDDDDVGGGGEFDVVTMMTPIPPPRVNRTKMNPIECSSNSPTDPAPTTTAVPSPSNTTIAAASSSTTRTTSSSIVQLAGSPPSLPIQCHRRQTFKPHTQHSLLDDCSDDEENDEDDDDDEDLSSSYVMINNNQQQQSQSASHDTSSWMKRTKKQTISPSSRKSQQMACNNIQNALLQTRHRRWEIQSSLCGSHAQSNQVFDLSTRVHYIFKFHNRQQHPFSFSPIRPSMTSSDKDIDDDGVALLARLSVPNDSVRAGALASGLWRTVRLVKLPQGLFGWHWVMWKEQRQVPDSVYFGDNMPLDNEVWSLLQMLGETFPNLEQVDFGGDIARSPPTASGKEQSDDAVDAYDKDEWRSEILTCIMQCLPKLIAVDGFTVEVDRGDEDETAKSNIMQEASADGILDDAPPNVNDEQDFIKTGSNGPARTIRDKTLERYRRSSSSSFNIPSQCDVATEASDAMEDVSENMMSLCGRNLQSDTHSEEAIPTEKDGLTVSIASENEVKLASSSLASSFSWGSAESSGTRPPTCPQSDTRRRLPTKPITKIKMKSKLSEKNKRRLKKLTGLIPSMSIMDTEEDDSDDDGTIW